MDPERFVTVTGGGLVELEDTTTYTIGVGRKFTDNWSGAMSFLYEDSEDGLISPLSPTNGRKAITLAAIYTQDQLKITTGINYTKLGGGDLRVDVECLDAVVTDVSERWPAKVAPTHPGEADA